MIETLLKQIQLSKYFQLSPTNMEDNITKLGTFTLHFPHQLHNQTNPISGTDQRELIFIGEEFDINIIAKSAIDPVEHNQELTKWKCIIQALQPVVTVVPVHIMGGAKSNEETHKSFTLCKPLASYKERLKDRKWLQLNSTTQVYPIRASFAHLDEDVTSCKVWVTLWGPAVDIPEKDDLSGLKQCIAKYPDIPDEALQQDGKILRQVVTKEMPLYPQPRVEQACSCRGGLQHISVKVFNPLSSKITVTHAELKLIVETYGSDDESGFSSELINPVVLPMTLEPCECYTFMYRLLVSEAEVYSDLLLPLKFEMEWKSDVYTKDTMHTQYRLPSVKLRRPPMLITPSPEEHILVGKPFSVTYTIVNELQDFLSLKLVWSPEKALSESKVQQNAACRKALQNVLDSVICQHPMSLLGPCSRGTTVTVQVQFIVLKPGLYEIGQHMKLNLQYYNPHPLTASLLTQGHGDHPRGNSKPAPTTIKGSHTHMTPGNSASASASPSHRRTSSLSPAIESNLSPAHGVSHGQTNGSVARTSSSNLLGARPTAQFNKAPGSSSPKSASTNVSRNPSAANSPAPTPTDLSPVHSGKLQGYVNIDNPRHFGGSPAPRHKFLTPYGPKSVSQVNSPMSPKHLPTPGPVLPHQVLKRNCQIYVQAAS